MPHRLRLHYNPCQGDLRSSKGLQEAHAPRPIGCPIWPSFVQPDQGLTGLGQSIPYSAFNRGAYTLPEQTLILA